MELEKRKIAYPKLSRIKHNCYYLGIIQNLYCGKEGEIAAFLQFNYQSNLLSPFGNDYSKIFARFAQDEVFHSILLSEILISLGGDPVYADNQGRWFSGRWVDYVKDIKQMLMLDIELKEKQIIEYKSAISKIDDISIKQMLSAILKDEEACCLELKRIKESLTQKI